MPIKTHKYTNGEVTVVWKPDTCIHSTLCWKGLIEVFNPKEKPWIRMEGADTERIIEQVRKCPSGALSYFMNENGESKSVEPEPERRDPQAERAQITEITVIANGPYRVKSECLIIHADGREEVRNSSFSLCRCGASANKPFCDGTHRKIGFEG